MAYAGLVIFLILLWIRPEYRFLLFYVFANSILVLALRSLSAPASFLDNTIIAAINDVILLIIGAPFVALRKWLKSRKSGAERRADAVVAQVRAEEEASRRAGGA